MKLSHLVFVCAGMLILTVSCSNDIEPVQIKSNIPSAASKIESADASDITKSFEQEASQAVSIVGGAVATDANIQNSVVYFGYFNDSLGSTTDYVDVTASLANVHWIFADEYPKSGGINPWPQYSPSPSPDAIAAKYPLKLDCSRWDEKFYKAKKYNHKVIVDINRVLFVKSGAPLGYSPILTPDYVYRFKSLLPCLTPYTNQIVGFYIFDEPYWNNTVAPSLPPWAASNAVNSSVYRNLAIASALIKTSFRNTKTITSLAFPEMQTGNTSISSDLSKVIPNNIDWYGLDCYLKEGSVCSESFIKSAMNKLGAMRKPGQSLIVFLDATFNSALTAQQADNTLIARNQFWLELTKNMPIAGYFPFIYQGGLNQMPRLKAYLGRVYRCTQSSGCVLNGLPIYSKPISDPAIVIPAGFFRAGNSAYHSLGSGAVCGYTSLQHISSCGQNTLAFTSGFDIGKLPDSVANGLTCQCGTQMIPYGTLYKQVNGSAIMQTGPTSSCGFNSMEHLTSCGFNANQYANAPRPPSKITALNSAALCQCGNQVRKRQVQHIFS